MAVTRHIMVLDSFHLGAMSTACDGGVLSRSSLPMGEPCVSTGSLAASEVVKPGASTLVLTADVNISLLLSNQFSGYGS